MTIRVKLSDLLPGSAYAIQFRSNDGSGNVSEWSQIQRFTTTNDTVHPGNVTNLTFSDTGDSFMATWDKVLVNQDGTAFNDFRWYHVQVVSGSNTVDYTTTTEKFEFSAQMNTAAFGSLQTSLTIKVWAVDMTHNESLVAAQVAATPQTPPTPSTPVVGTYLGLLLVTWDGKQASGAAMPKNVSYCEVHVSATSNFTPSTTTYADKVYPGGAASKVTIPNLTYGTTYYVRLVAVNVFSKSSGASTQASGVPQRISGLDIQDGQIGVNQINFTARQLGAPKAFYQTSQPTTGMLDSDVWFDTDDNYQQYVYTGGTWRSVRDLTIALAQTAATTAQTTANGKNTVNYAASAPSDTINPGIRAGDIWFVRNSVTGLITAQYEWSGTTWQIRTLDNAVIANLDAGKITAGTINAARIGANSITTDKIAIGDFTNYADGGDFENSPITSWTLSSGAVIDTAQFHTGTKSLKMPIGAAATLLSTIPAKAGDQFTISFWYLTTSDYNGTGSNSKIRVADQNSNLLTAYGIIGAKTVWTQQVNTYTVPAGATTGLKITIGTDQTVGSYWLDDIEIRRVIPSVQIADGAIIASKISAGAVTANAIKTGAVTADAVGTNLIIASKANIGNAVIDQANIATVNAASITTGQLSVGQKIIAGPASSTHAEMSDTGFRVFASDPVDGIPNEVIRLGTSSDDYFAIVASDGSLSASIDGTGRANFSNISADNWPEINATDYSGQGGSMLDILDRRPRGIVAYGADTGSYTTNTTAGTGIFDITARLWYDRMYKIGVRCRVNGAVANDALAEIQVRYEMSQDGVPPGPWGGTTPGRPATPTINSAIAGRYQASTARPEAQGIHFEKLFSFGRNPSIAPTTLYKDTRFLLCAARPVGGTTLTVYGTNPDNIELWIEDIGPYIVPTATINNGGGGASAPPPAPQAQRYNRTWVCDWHQNWQGTAAFTNLAGAYQGLDPSGANGNMRSYLGFSGVATDGSGLNIDAALSGAIIEDIGLYLYANHWYYNSGGEAVIGMHGFRTPPAAYGGGNDWMIGSAGWPKPGGRWVSLAAPGVNLQNFATGVWKGIMLGSAGAGDLGHYGRFDAEGSAQLNITYRK